MERGNDKVSWKIRFHNDFRSVISWIEGHMTFKVRFLEINITYHHITIINYHNSTKTLLLWITTKYHHTLLHYHHKLTLCATTLPSHTTMGMNRVHGGWTDPMGSYHYIPLHSCYFWIMLCQDVCLVFGLHCKLIKMIETRDNNSMFWLKLHVFIRYLDQFLTDYPETFTN